MACENFQQQLNNLQQERRQLASTMEYLQGAGLQAAQAQLANLDANIARTQSDLDLCLAQDAQAQNPQPQTVTGRVDRIRCIKARKEIGPDEPYILIAGLDMLGFIGTPPASLAVPSIRVVKIGPWSGVDKNETHYAFSLEAPDRPLFWDLDGQARHIAHPEDVMFLVAVVENDGASPDAIREAVQVILQESKWSNLSRVYNALRDTLISSMTGAIDTARIAGLTPGHLNADDRIGRVQHLALTPDDLDHLQNLEPVEKSLTFTQTKSTGRVLNSYEVTFSFEV
ncbi:MAG: hypothetical protein AAGF01_15930 [Cyanobacteria bacterium P01_G01_bin.38]